MSIAAVKAAARGTSHSEAQYNNNSMREIEESLRTMRNRIFNAYIRKIDEE
jgi:hypothetical protein